MFRTYPKTEHISGIFVAPGGPSYETLKQIFKSMTWRLWRADTWQSGLLSLAARSATHLLYQHASNDRQWIEALSVINCLPSPPAFILTSRLGDERLWADVLNRGGYDLLLEPFDSLEVTRIVAAAHKNSCDRLCLSALAG